MSGRCRRSPHWQRMLRLKNGGYGEAVVVGERWNLAISVVPVFSTKADREGSSERLAKELPPSPETIYIDVCGGCVNRLQTLRRAVVLTAEGVQNNAPLLMSPLPNAMAAQRPPAADAVPGVHLSLGEEASPFVKADLLHG